MSVISNPPRCERRHVRFPSSTTSGGEKEAAHVHKVATELTMIVSGQVKMNGRVFAAGDIVVLKPGEATDFEALTDTTTTVVKLPSAKGDKYLVGE